MSVRKQILLSHKTLLKEFLEANILGSSIEPKHVPVAKPQTRTLPNRKVKKAAKFLESSSEEECDYDSGNEDVSFSPKETEDYEVEEKMTSVPDVDPKSVKTEVTDETVTMKIEPELTEPTPVQPQQPLSPHRLRKKQNLMAASNRILQQEKTLADRRYSNVIFVRKSMRDKLKRQAQGEKSKSKKEKSDETNIIWKNGKKYAACEICKKEVKKHYLKHHMSTHFPEHFSCDICGVTTRNLRGLRYHKLYWHSSKLDYICDKCGKKYRSKHALDLHSKKEHGGVRDLECNICGKKFFQKMHLKRHIDGIHKKLRPHKCEYCGKDFTKRTHLVTHWRTHTNETPYGCDMCGDRFKLKLSLKNHLRRAHNYEEKERVFCDVCQRGFASEQGLRAHINSRIHEGEKCQYCAESFTPEYLKVHLREVHLHVDFF